MIGLPDGIRSNGFTPVNQFERIAVGFAALMGECEKVSGQVSNDVIDDRVFGAWLTYLLSEPPRLAADHCNGQWRLLQSKTFDGLFDPCGYRSPFAAMKTKLYSSAGARSSNRRIY